MIFALKKTAVAALLGFLGAYIGLVIAYLGWFMSWGARHNAEPVPVFLTAIPYAVVASVLAAVTVAYRSVRKVK